MGGDLSMPPRPSPHVHGLAGIIQHPQEQMLGPDPVMAQRLGLLAGQPQGAFGDQRRATQRRPYHPPAPPATSAGHPPGRLPDHLDAEGVLGVAPHGIQVDAQRAQQLSVTRPRRRHHALIGQAGQCGPGRSQLHPSRPQHPSGSGVAVGEEPEQDVLGAEVAVASPLGLRPGQIHDPVGLLGEAAEHLVAD
jgi:hypothetical protein